MDTIITAAEVVEAAYSNATYIPEEMITSADITTAERRYLLPVVGQELYEALLDERYEDLRDDYVAIVVALYTREVANLASAPRSHEGLQRSREMLRRLSDHLDDNEDSYPEYDSSANILKRCMLDGGFVQVH